MTPSTRAPIFIVGSPRSGTNIFYRKFARHPDLAWVSSVTKKIPDSLWLTRLLMIFLKDHGPTEAKNIWDRFVHGDDHALGRDDATPEARRFLHKVVQNHLTLFHKPRFVNKCPRNSVRVEFFDAVFPDAYFIHVIRDGRAVAHSILRSRQKHGNAYWGVRPPGWRTLLDLPMIEACALQWKFTVEHLLRAAETIPAERYMEVRYEEFVAQPEAILRAVGEKCGLEWDPALLRELVGDLENRNFKWRNNFTPAEIARLNELLGDLLTRLGYEV